MVIANRFTRSSHRLARCTVDHVIFSIKLVMLGLAPFVIDTARPLDAFGGCAPGCKICLLDVCSDAPQSRPGEQKSGSGQQQPPGPTSDDPAVNLDKTLKGLNPGDTSSPVTEWAGMSQRDFVLAMWNDFAMAGHCIDLQRARDQLSELNTGLKTDRLYCPRCAREDNENVKNASSVTAKYGENTASFTVAQQAELLGDDARATEWANDHPGDYVYDSFGHKYPNTNPYPATIREKIKKWHAQNAKQVTELNNDVQDIQAKLGRYDCEKQFWPQHDATMDPKEK